MVGRVVYRFLNGLGYHMLCGSLNGTWETGTHSRARGGCHVSAFPGRGVTHDPSSFFHQRNCLPTRVLTEIKTLASASSESHHTPWLISPLSEFKNLSYLAHKSIANFKSILYGQTTNHLGKLVLAKNDCQKQLIFFVLATINS